MKKLLILLLVLSSCVVNRYSCNTGYGLSSIQDKTTGGKCTPLGSPSVTEIMKKYGMITPGRICDPPAGITFTPGAVTNLPFLEKTKVNKWYILKDSTLTKHIFFGYSDMDTIGGRYFTLTKNILMRPSSGTVVWSPLATDTTLTKNKLIIKQ